MSFLLDTNFLSEWVKPRPNSGVMRWVDSTDEDDLFLSVVTLAELRRGIERLPAGARRTRLNEWLENDLQPRFEKRVVHIDAEIADMWGRIVAKREVAGRPISAMDAFIAATAEALTLALVTRNVSDFQASVGVIINPWTPE